MERPLCRRLRRGARAAGDPRHVAQTARCRERPGARWVTPSIGRDNTPESLVFDNWFGVFTSRDAATDRDARLIECSRGTDVYEGHTRSSRRRAARRRRSNAAHRLKNSLVELLMKQDQMSMAASIESRVPFLDYQLVEFAASIPASLKIRSHTGKHLLKRSLAGMLPDSIINRPKEGFPVPFDSWLRERCSLPLSPCSSRSARFDCGWITAEGVRSIVAEHRSGRTNLSRQLWTLWGLETWARAFLDGERKFLRATEAPESAAALGGTAAAR